jgi:ABC-2 type transport system permease protein
MNNFWLVAKQEFRNRTFKRSFVIGTFAFPVLMAIIIGIVILIVVQSFDRRPFGYVDYSGALENSTMPNDGEDSVEIIAFPDEISARAALDAEEIQGYHILPEDYLETLYVDLYYLEEAPGSEVLVDFDDYVRANILDETKTTTQIRIMDGTSLTIRAMDGSREFKDNATGIIVVLLPLIIAMFFLFVVMGASGYFLQVVTDEKENRTMELMLTSVSPSQLIGGKSIGLVAVGLTQLTVWIASIAVAWIVAQQYFEILRDVTLPWDVLLIFAIFFLPSYAIVAGLMICIGAIVTEIQEGQQISGIINLLFTFPIFFAALVFADPDSPFMVVLSFWPTTSLMTIIMRWGFTVIPLWQVAISWIICVISGIAIIWVASRIFKLGMLRYGQRLTLKAAFAALRPSNNR